MRETVTAFLHRTRWATRHRTYGWQFRKDLPTIPEINGQAVLRKDWRHRRISACAEVRCVSYPRGGRGGGRSSLKQILIPILGREVLIEFDEDQVGAVKRPGPRKGSENAGTG